MQIPLGSRRRMIGNCGAFVTCVPCNGEGKRRNDRGVLIRCSHCAGVGRVKSPVGGLK